jgi:hypothetical protein
MAKVPQKEATSFAEAIESSLPDPGTLESPFQKVTNTPGVKTVTVNDPANPYNIPFKEMSFTYFHEVFLIHRQWNQCRRCLAALESKKVELPEVGDYLCPHNRKSEYITIVQKFLTEGYIKQSMREETLVDGSIQISIAWLVPKEDKSKKKKPLKAEVQTSEDPSY